MVEKDEVFVHIKVTLQELGDLVNALDVATEELDYRQELSADYDDEDIANMAARNARLGRLQGRIYSQYRRETESFEEARGGR